MSVWRSKTLKLAASCVTATLSLFAAGGLAPANAATTTSSTTAAVAPISVVTMSSEPGDYIGGGQQLIFVPPSSTIAAQNTSSKNRISVSVNGDGTPAHWFTFMFGSGNNTQLKPGIYSAGTGASGMPGTIEIFGDGRGCDNSYGAFQIRDIAWGANNVLTRLSMSYIDYCEGGLPALFGEVRFNEPASTPLVLGPAHLDFPPAYPGVAAIATVAVVNRTSKPVKVGTPSITGKTPKAFSITGTTCAGATLPAGGACAAYLRFRPLAAGAASAQLNVPSGGKAFVVPLTGSGIPGLTNFSYSSQPGDWIGGGTSGTFTPLNSGILVRGTTGAISGVVNVPAGFWMISLAAPAGGALLPGTYLNAARASFHGTQPGLEIDSPGHGCNTVTGSYTIKEVSYDPLSSALTSISVSMVQHCDGETAGLTATLNYRVPQK